jgi:Icc-related predicted phosphoesterase
MTKIVCISDTHCRLRKITIPEGDILVHSGDLTFQGNISETSQEIRELGRYAKNFKAIVLVEGNHDWLGSRNPELMGQMCADNGITLLRDSDATIEGLRFYGSPWQPEFHNWAFNLPRGQALRDKWALIPADTQVLLTHGPPMGILDGVMKYNHSICEWELQHLGCTDLYNRVMELKDLRLHNFGHLHLGYGSIQIGTTRFVNAAINTEEYKPANAPIVIEI